MTKKLIVAVTGSTGKQGGAVVKTLLERGHQVRAVTRNPDSTAAKELAKKGATSFARHSTILARLRRRWKGRHPSLR